VEPPLKRISSESAATPGDVYDEDTEILNKLFVSGGNVIVGPETDKWGTVISGFASIKDPLDNTIIAVIGFDYEAKEWVLNIERRRLVFILITFIFTLLFLSFFTILKIKEEGFLTVQAREGKLRELMSQLDDEKRNLETIFDSAQVGLLLVDSQFKVKRVNQMVLDMGGQDFFSVFDHQPGDALSCVNAKTSQEGCGTTEECKTCLVRATANKILETGQIIRGAEISRTICLANGQEQLLWFAVNASPMDIRGERHILFSLDDITDRKKMQEELLASREYLVKIIDSISDPIFVKDSQHRWDLVNEAFCVFMGHTKEELYGKSDYDFFPKEEADVFWAKDEDVFRRGLENVNEEFFTDEQGVRRAIITKKVLYKDLNGREFIVGIIHDVTEAKLVEEKERKRAHELEVFYKASIGREERIIELKKELTDLKRKLGIEL
ncbi:MAG: PAS domain S-box protein, partial [Candidatus Omnitrophica bacterium]|nr:PAS domain S-box protein [Candidatus Omnitrophota bacterium]